jgi:hypothetical protein
MRVNLQDCADLQEGRADLQQRWKPPTPVSNDISSADSDGSSHNGTDEVRCVEQRGHCCTLLWVGQLSDQSRSGDDGEKNAHAKKHTRYDVHAN